MYKEEKYMHKTVFGLGSYNFSAVKLFLKGVEAQLNLEATTPFRNITIYISISSIHTYSVCLI